MSLKIFIMALSFISSTFVLAEEQVKSSVNVSFQFPKSDVPNILNEVSAKKFLRNKGIITDEISKVLIHEEQNTINLHCFDCLIERVDPRIELNSSFNERTTSKHAF